MHCFSNRAHLLSKSSITRNCCSLSSLKLKQKKYYYWTSRYLRYIIPTTSLWLYQLQYSQSYPRTSLGKSRYGWSKPNNSSSLRCYLSSVTFFMQKLNHSFWIIFNVAISPPVQQNSHLLGLSKSVAATNTWPHPTKSSIFFGAYLYAKNLTHWLLPSRNIDERILQSDWMKAYFSQ